MRANRVAFVAVLAAVWSYAVLQPGAGPEWDRKPYLLAMGLTGILYWAMERREEVAIPRVLQWSAWLLPAYVALQMVPLPVAVLDVLSPGRAELLRELAAVGPAERFATISIAPGTTMTGFLLVCGYGVMFLVVYHMSVVAEKRRWAMVAPLAVVATLEVCVGMMQAAAGREVSGTYANRDHYAGLLEMVLPFCLVYPMAVWQRRRDRRQPFPLRAGLRMCAALGVAALLLMGVLSSLSRMGFLAVLVALLAMVGAARIASGWRGVGIAGLAVAAVAGCFVLLPSDQLISRFGRLSTTDLTGDLRLRLWAESLRLYRAFPVFGCGLGTYESGFLRYKALAPLSTADYAHNDYLQLLIELGVVGFAIGAVLFTRIAMRTAAATSRRYDPDTRFLAIGCIGAFAAIAMHSLVDFNLYVPANAAALAWIAGLAASLHGTARRLPDKLGAGLPQVIDVTPRKLTWSR